MEATTIGIDLAKHVFQVHGVDEAGAVVLRRRLRRGEVVAVFSELAPCLSGMEACASAHHWARELGALGHEVRLMPPSYVKPYVKRQKNDAADAAAICEAVRRPSMRFVAVKTAEQQAVLVLHRSRDLLVRQRTMLVNAIRAHCAEFGVIAARGRAGVGRLLAAIEAGEAGEAGEVQALPEPARGALSLLGAQLREADARIKALEGEIRAWHRASPASRRLAAIPGIGPGDRADHRQRARRHRGRCPAVPLGTRVGRLARPGAQTSLDRRQAAPGRHLQAGRPLPAPAPGDRRHRRAAPPQAQGARRRRLAEGAARPAPGARRHRGARQQERAHRLGPAGPR